MRKKIMPSSVAVGVNLANVLKALSKFCEAEVCYQSLLAANPDNVDILYNLGVLYQSNFQNNEAETVYCCKE